MIKQNPFSLYDFLGYFIPGATLLYMYMFFLSFSTSNNDVNLKDCFIKDNIKLENFLFFIIISYAIGHLTNFLSSVLIEKYANWIYDYPSKYLLKLHKEFKFKTISIKRIFIFICILPVSILDLLFGQLLKFKNLYVHHLDDFLIYSIKTKIDIIINKLIPHDQTNKIPKEIGGYDFFRILQHYAYEQTQNHQSKLINYVVLYGFLRSMTFICVILFWFLIYIKIFVNSNNIPFEYLLITIAISYIFFMAFMKFYRRYSLEVMMIIAILEEDNITNKKE